MFSSHGGRRQDRSGEMVSKEQRRPRAAGRVSIALDQLISAFLRGLDELQGTRVSTPLPAGADLNQASLNRF
jgi:hypothetical protein